MRQSVGDAEAVGGTGDDVEGAEPAEQPEPLSALLPTGLRSALAGLDKMFELVRRDSDPPAITEALHDWLRKTVVNEYAAGLVKTQRTRRPLPRHPARRGRPDPKSRPR